MSLRGKYERARRWQREQRGLDSAAEKMKRDSERPLLSDEMEKGDRFAVYFSAFTTLFLPAALLIAAIGGFLLLLVNLF